jgi:AbrB family looped-hinge helix DNA binding protein
LPLVSISSKGQMLVPKKVREALKLKPGQKALLNVRGGHAELVPLPPDPVEGFCGIFEEGPSLTQALLKERKEEREVEEKNTPGLVRAPRLPKKRR